MSGQQLMQSVKRFLIRDRGLNFTDEWLEACVDWIKENHPTRRSDAKFLQDEVHNQWLDANLMEIGCHCLPAKLADQKRTVLEEKYVLQVNTVEDIGEASYSQWNKLKKLENENTDVNADGAEQRANNWEPKPRRCLYLTMTDGTQDVYGMELAYVPQLSLDMKPGVKVQIIGPVQCRRGVIHLRAPSIKILGGEVEALLDINSYENVLQRRMNLKKEDRPKLPRPTYKKPPDPPNMKKVSVTAGRTMPTSTPSSSFHSRPTQPVPPPFAQPSSFMPSHSSHRNPRNRSAVKVEEDPFADGDDVFMDIDETLLMAENNHAEDTTQIISQGTNSGSQPQRVPALVPSSSSSSNHPVIDIIDDDDDDFIFSQIPITPAAAPPPAKKSKLCSQQPFQFIKFIKDNLSNLKIGKIVYVKACVATLVSNVCVQEGNWSLRVNLNDGSGFLETIVAHELLNRLIGYSAAEIKQLKASSNPADKLKIRTAMSGLSNSLVHMNGLFGIKILKPFPVIASFQDIQSLHAQALRSRVTTL